MTRTAPPPPTLKIKTLFTPSTFVCLLALSLCSTPTSTNALPISSSSSSIPDQTKDTTLAIDTTSTDSPLAPAPPQSSPFRTVSRPITIQLDLNTPSGDSFTRLIDRTEKQEQFLREREQQDQEELFRLQQEQDELEKFEQERDQLLDNQEEEQQDQDPETVRRRQEESLGLWMTDAEFKALSREVNSNNAGSEDCEGDQLYQSDDESILLNRGSRFDLYAEDFKEVGTPENGDDKIKNFEQRQRGDRKLRLQRQLPPSEEEMLRWPIVNLSQFEDRQDEVQDEYDEQA
ncbi:hypothetical protein EDD21DRAFT_352036 [Dissophora ornata]|nr:hypothetical protein EDD21DRAFT_352036 [Dissophora ornata]